MFVTMPTSLGTIFYALYLAGKDTDYNKLNTEVKLWIFLEETIFVSWVVSGILFLWLA